MFRYVHVCLRLLDVRLVVVVPVDLMIVAGGLYGDCWLLVVGR